MFLNTCAHLSLAGLHAYKAASEERMPRSTCVLFLLTRYTLIQLSKCGGDLAVTILPENLSFFSHSVVSDSMWLHGLQHTRHPCPSLSPRARTNSCSLSQWCHPTISSSVVPFSSCPQSFPASGSFPMRWLFISGGQILELQLQHQSKEQSGLISFVIDWLDLLAVQGTLKSLLQHHSSKAAVGTHVRIKDFKI